MKRYFSQMRGEKMKKIYWIFLFCFLIGTNDIATCSNGRPPKVDIVETINIIHNEL